MCPHYQCAVLLACPAQIWHWLCYNDLLSEHQLQLTEEWVANGISSITRGHWLVIEVPHFTFGHCRREELQVIKLVTWNATWHNRTTSESCVVYCGEDVGNDYRGQSPFSTQLALMFLNRFWLMLCKKQKMLMHTRWQPNRNCVEERTRVELVAFVFWPITMRSSSSWVRSRHSSCISLNTEEGKQLVAGATIRQFTGVPSSNDLDYPTIFSIWCVIALHNNRTASEASLTIPSKLGKTDVSGVSSSVNAAVSPSLSYSTVSSAQ